MKALQLMFIRCSFVALIVGVCVRSLLYYAVLFVLSCFAITPLGEVRTGILVYVVVLCLFLTVPWVGL